MRLISLRRILKRILSPRRVSQKIKGHSNVLSWGDSTLDGVAVRIDGNFNEVRLEPGVTLRNLEIVIFGDHHRVLLGAGSSFNRGGQIWMEDSHGLMSIGERTTIEEAHLAVTEPQSEIVIGNDCMLANGVEIRTGDSHGIYDEKTRSRVNAAKSVRVGDRVWIAAHATLLKGAQVGDDSVVGTGAIVTKAFRQANVVLAGNPARIVREGILWTRAKGPTC